jgi:hypothetical protein
MKDVRCNFAPFSSASPLPFPVFGQFFLMWIAILIHSGDDNHTFLYSLSSHLRFIIIQNKAIYGPCLHHLIIFALIC